MGLLTKRMNAEDLVLVTVKYKVLALRKADGSLLWETELVKKFFKPATPFVSLAVDEKGVYAHALGELFRLDILTGQILWRKELPDDSWVSNQSVASVATLNSGQVSTANQAAKIQSDRRQSD